MARNERCVCQGGCSWMDTRDPIWCFITPPPVETTCVRVKCHRSVRVTSDDQPQHYVRDGAETESDPFPGLLTTLAELQSRKVRFCGGFPPEGCCDISATPEVLTGFASRKSESERVWCVFWYWVSCRDSPYSLASCSTKRVFFAHSVLYIHSSEIGSIVAHAS